MERSNGIFGKIRNRRKKFYYKDSSQRVIRNQKGVNLIFDMHSEYGWKGSFEGENRNEVRGLKQFFGDKVAVFTLDRESSIRRKSPIDFDIKIPYKHVTVEDIVLLQNELNLTSTAVETCYAFVNFYGE